METQFQISKRKLQAILNQMETQFQISKGSSSNTKSNGNSSLSILNQFESPTQTPRVCLNRVPLTGSIVRGGGIILKQVQHYLGNVEFGYEGHTLPNSHNSSSSLLIPNQLVKLLICKSPNITAPFARLGGCLGPAAQSIGSAAAAGTGAAGSPGARPRPCPL